jgi:hypothetical protein
LNKSKTLTKMSIILERNSNRNQVTKKTIKTKSKIILNKCKIKIWKAQKLLQDRQHNLKRQKISVKRVYL